MQDYETLIGLLREGQRFLIVSHANPDGDGIGSSLALATALEGMGKAVVVYNRDSVPANIAFLPGVERVTTKIDAQERFDLTIMLDCAERVRVSDDFAAFGGAGRVVCIDHHLLKESDADIEFIDSAAASTGEVVYRFMEHAGLPIGVDVAQCVYTTLVVDTGFFRYSNTTAKVLGLAACLVEKGAEPWTVAKELEESHPAERLQLLAHSLATLAFAAEGQIATMAVTREMLAETGATLELSDEFAGYPRAIAGVEVAALFRETDEGVVKVSLRSKDRVDVAAIARALGGGGHARAAGVRIRGTLDEAKAKIMKALEKALTL